MGEFRRRILRPLSFPLTAIVFVGVLVISLSRILLAVPVVGSTLIALVAAAEVLGIAFVLASTSRIKPAQRALILVLALALIGGGGASAEIGVRHEEPVAGVPVAIAAKGIAFDTKELHFPADTKVSLHFTNDDISVQHNVAIFTDAAQSAVLFRGPTITGPASIPYAVPPLKPGHYYFHCDVHPQQMNGKVVVGGPAGAPSGQPTNVPTAPPVTSSSVPPPPAGGTPVTSLTVVAKTISFDVNQIVLKANSTITLTLDNQAAGIPHNLAILTSENGTKIFGQAPFSGPAKETWTFTSPAPGQYFFHCEVHATMKGTVIVR
jgi:plastocyanin